MLLGRDRELTVLRNALDSGESAAVVGEAGVGKTTLMEAASAEAERTVLRGIGLASLDWLSYMPLSRALAREVPASADAAAVAQMVREEVGDGVLQIDDLHWADRDTLETLGLLAGVTVVAAIRRGDPGSDRAIGVARDAGMQILELDPLGTEIATELVHRVNPDLDEAGTAEVVEHAGGNPLVLEELAIAGDATPESLRLSLAARLRRLAPDASETVCRMALLGRPAMAEELEADPTPALEAGMAIERDGTFELRHALLGDAAVATLSNAETAEMHARLARVLTDRGEAARHHFAAGELEAAHDAAIAAADATERPGERASHLALAARAAPALAEADGLRLRAARELLAAGRHDEALELAEGVVSDDPASRAEINLVRGTAVSIDEGPLAAIEHFDRGLETVPEEARTLEVELMIARSKALLFAYWGSPEAVAACEQTHLRTEELGHCRAEGLYVLAMARFCQDAPDASAVAEAAWEWARAEGDYTTERDAAATLASLQQSQGDWAGAARSIEAGIARARELSLRSAEILMMSLQALSALQHEADYPKAIALFEEILGESGSAGMNVGQFRAAYAVALFDIGRAAEARQVLADALESASGDADQLYYRYVEADFEWHEGHLKRAIAVASEVVDLTPDNPNRILIATTLAWASYELDGFPVRTEYPAFRGGFDPGKPEVAALEAMAEQRFADAERLFDEAAAEWSKNEVRLELRCLWGAGEAAAAAGDLDGARERMLALEARAERYGLVPMLGRIQRSLRRLGVVRSAAPDVGPDSAAGELSRREREVIELVGEGLTSAQIATRLGVARSTVESQVQAAMRKLGARSRKHAVALLTSESGASSS